MSENEKRQYQERMKLSGYMMEVLEIVSMEVDCIRTIFSHYETLTEMRADLLDSIEKQLNKAHEKMFREHSSCSVELLEAGVVE